MLIISLFLEAIAVFSDSFRQNFVASCQFTISTGRLPPLKQEGLFPIMAWFLIDSFPRECSAKVPRHDSRGLGVIARGIFQNNL